MRSRLGSCVRRVTVGIPAYNEEQNIANLLLSLEEEQQTQTFEIIISDDSTDDTSNIVRKFAQKSLLDIKLFHSNIRRSTAAAWNQIFQEATGDTIVLYDADTIPHPSCTKELLYSVQGNVGLCASNPQPVQAAGTAGRASVFISNWLRGVRLTGLSQYTVMGRALAIDSYVAKKTVIPTDLIAVDLYVQCKTLEMGRKVIYNDNAIVYFKPVENMLDMTSQVMRAVNGHQQIGRYISTLDIALPLQVALIQAVKNAAKDPLGALSVAVGYSLMLYYRSRLENVDTARWHTATSSKAIDYQELKTHF
jgi:glycosyltransferase involved in cell wall biosynthesis